MSEVLQNAPQEFWRPPAHRPDAAVQGMDGACRHCGTEFLVGASFCHGCGTARQSNPNSFTAPHWTRWFALLRFLEFHSVKRWLALPTGSLIAFLAGVGCVLAAIAVGLIYSVQSLADFQAIQLWRIQWLLGALAAFAAGILLNRRESPGKTDK